MNNCNERTWTEENRNQFHPGSILALIIGQIELSPRGNRELVELTSHFLGYTREYSDAYMDGQMFITGFYARWVAKMKAIAGPLAELYPELALYGAQLKKRGFLEDCVEDAIVRNHIFNEMEAKFGRFITVLPNMSNSPINVIKTESPRKKTENWSAGTFQPGSPKLTKGISFPPIKGATPFPGKK